MKKLFIILGAIAGVVVGFGITLLIIFIINTINNSTSTENIEDARELVEATEVREHEIDLNNYDTNIALVEEGEYQLYGDFSHLIQINIPTGQDAEDKPQVTLFLNDVNITSDTTAIDNIYYNDLIINAPLGTNNTITSVGDTVINTVGHLAIDGQGILTVWNQQTAGLGVAVVANNIGIYGGEIVLIGGATDTSAGVSTKDRYWIKGGDVTILGTDMLESPVSNDANLPDITPRSASFSLKQTYPANSKIKVLNSKGARVATYTAPAEFRTVIVSNNLITPGEYTLYVDDTKIKTTEVE